MEDFRIRLVNEYKELIEKRVRLDKYIYDSDNEVGDIDAKERQLLQEQLEAMFRYEEILYTRIIRMLGVK